MNGLREVQYAILRLERSEIEAIRDFIDDYLEEQVEVSDEVAVKIAESKREIAAGEFRTRV